MPPAAKIPIVLKSADLKSTIDDPARIGSSPRVQVILEITPIA